MRSKPQPALLKLKEAAEIVRVSPRTIRRYTQAGTLPAKRTPGGQLRYQRSAVEGLLREEEPADDE